MKITNKSASKTIRVFLSYVASDKIYAHYLRTILDAVENLDVYTVESVGMGTDWVSELHRHIEESDLYIGILSPESTESSSILFEMGAAWGLEKPMILAYTDKNVFARIPFDLRSIRLIDIAGLTELDDNNPIADSIRAAVGKILQRPAA